MVQFRTWLKKGEVDVVYAIKLDRLEPIEGTVQTMSSQGKDGVGVRPSERLKQEGVEVDSDVGKLLDEFSDVFQDLPPGGVKNREIKHRIPTVPGQLL